MLFRYQLGRPSGIRCLRPFFAVYPECLRHVRTLSVYKSNWPDLADLMDKPLTSGTSAPICTLSC
jgi:hypothetical protein